MNTLSIPHRYSKTFFLFLIGSLNVLFSFNAHAGTESGGGGRGVVCYDDEKVIKSVELLDLYEGYRKYGWGYQSLASHFYDQAQARLSQILEATNDSIFGRDNKLYGPQVLIEVYSRMVLLPDDSRILPIDDSFEKIAPTDCEIKQIAYYSDEDQILLIDGSVWAHMNETNRAALLVHETLYKMQRALLREKDSRRSRRAVSYSFSNQSLQKIRADLPTKDLFSCFIGIDRNSPEPPPWSFFFMYNNPDGTIQLQFETLGGRILMSKSSLHLEPLKVPAESIANETIGDFWFGPQRIESLLENAFLVSLTFGKGWGGNKIAVQVYSEQIRYYPFYCAPGYPDHD